MQKNQPRATQALQWWQRQRIARALTRYSSGMGGQLSGGIALTGLLSVAAALTIALTALVGVFKRHPEFKDAVFFQIDELLPGVIDMGSGQGVKPDDLLLDTGWNIAGVVAVLVLLNTATGVMKSLRTALRSMFGLHNAAENFVISKLRDLGAFLGLGVSVLATSLLSIGGQAAFDWIQSTIGHWGVIPDTRFVLQALTIGIGLLIDAGVFILLFRWLAGARVPWPDLWRGAAIGALGTGVLRYLGASVVANVADKPLLASAAAVATLLLWLNIAARVTLLAAAWTANPPAPPKLTKNLLQHSDETPNYVSISHPASLEWDYEAYSGLIHPLPSADADYSANQAAVRARENTPSTSRLGMVARLKAYLEAQNQPDGYVYPGPQPPAQQEETSTSLTPPPLIRFTPDSPLGRLRERFFKTPKT